MEILFKGIRTDGGGWTEGDLTHTNKSFAPSIHQGLGKIFKVHLNTICQFTGLYDATAWQDLTDDQRDSWTLDGNDPSEWKGWKLFSDDLIADDNRTMRIYMTEGGFAIKVYYWASEIGDLTPSDELILQALPDAQTRSYIEGSCKRVGNVHDKKRDHENTI